MTRRRFSVIDVVEILVHWHAGRPKAEVARVLEVDRSTVRKYTAKAEAEGISPGGPGRSREEWAALVRGWFPELTDARARSITHDKVEP
ncbi:MAG: IS21 family transposase, partial [Acidimicrobiales bacterium]